MIKVKQESYAEQSVKKRLNSTGEDRIFKRRRKQI